MSRTSRRLLDPCCALRQQLAKTYSTSARLHAEAVMMLTSVPQQPELIDHLHDLERKAQQLAEDAHAEFEEHVQDHGC